MNENTRIAVCCYNGDQHQVIKVLGNYLQHRRPVVVLSPDDAKAEIRYPGIETRFGGKRAYIGQESLDRQRIHLTLLLGYPEEFFLIHDADSVCLTPELPAYLYKDELMLWSNVVDDGIPGRDGAYPIGYPRIAFQPPYFLSRKTIARLLAGTEGVRANPVLPFIDHYMLQLAIETGCPYKSFPDGISCPISSDYASRELSAQSVRECGVIFLHSIKRPEDLNRMLEERGRYVAAHLH